MCQQGIEYVFDHKLSKDKRIAELAANLAQGNHNSANLDPKELEEKMDREVKHGFALPVWTSIIKQIQKSMLQACGLVTQWALSETGERKKKSQ